MVEAGASADHAQEMYDESVTTVVLAAVIVAVVASIVLAIVLARMLARPLAEVGGAARRIADGDYAARVPREGPEELASLADSFNQMAASLERQEAMRRDFIANAAHELRTPLTNLQGYLEALRDGVIVADRATYDSLWDEAERLVRLSHSLDALAEGDAATSPPALEELDLAAAIRAALELAQPTLERAGLRSSSTSRTAPGPGQPGPARPGPRQPAVQRRPLHAGRRDRHRPCRTAAGGPPGSIANTGEGIPPDDLERVFERFYRVEKSRDRARGGAGIGLAIVKQLVEAGRRPRRCGIARRADALLVQPAGLTGVGVTGGRCRPSRQRSRASPSHWIGLRRSPRNATATRIVTAGPNDAASPTIQVGADLEADREDDRARATSSMPASVIAPTTVLEPRPRRRSVAGHPPRGQGQDDRMASDQTGVHRSSHRVELDPAHRLEGDVGDHRHQREQDERHDREDDARTREPCRPPAAIEGDPGQHDPDGRDIAPTAWSGVNDSPRKRTERTTVNPPNAATMPLTTEIGPIWRPVK